ncbi:hypothetical protein ZIOFF_035022 [Zingiber officinale]|uniref:Uncharacterized protein n=1 Tax=Zingiber officinale TaxID=94328 RepID=A0A8J5L6U4_ZINOF|nr:hypothetical protein ZIOFF_035022 [Zingiber officinale]
MACRLIKVAPPAVDPVDHVDYSFAVEYQGPPVPYDLPRAFPIDVDRIPLAFVAPPSAALPDLPVVHPLPSPSSYSPMKLPQRLPLPTEPAMPAAPSISVIDNRASMEGPDADASVEPGSSGVLGSSSLVDPSTELSEVVDSSGAIGFSDEFCDGFASADDMAPNRLSTESTISMEFGFQSSASGDEHDEAVAVQAKKALLATFQESGESSCSMSPAIVDSPQERSEEMEVKIKKGACYKCLKGSRFTEKESCLVCDAKYCSGCVLRAMGSMPEGRKCISCIGSPILESNRERLGKSSRVLKKLLSSREVQQLMKIEKSCEENQLKPEDICVNGKKLSMDEMVLLQSCPVPPPKLKPGFYWYDKVSGYWGKEGHKPDNIISPHLNVGSALMRNASNGNTGVLINGREITKVELKMLKWAGVHCAGSPHFWLNADGTYLEEGQKTVKGMLWKKTRMKLLCPVLSLPFPSKVANGSGEETNNLLNQSIPDHFDTRALQKFLLVGHHGSGSSTIFKQAKFLYKSVPFSEEERQDIKLLIQTNIYNYLGLLLEGREHFEEEILAERIEQSDCSGDIALGKKRNMTEYSINARLKAFSDWLLKVMASGNLDAIFPASTREYAPLVEELWNDSAIQATYRRINELQSLPSNASYFLERVVDMSRIEYEPSDIDILYADGISSSNGLMHTNFQFPPSAYSGRSIDDDDLQETLLRSVPFTVADTSNNQVADTNITMYQLIRINTKGLGDNCKWFDMFEDVRIVIFPVAITDYDEYYEDTNGMVKNRMMESKRLFECIASHPSFEDTYFLLILSKFDLLEQKIDIAPLTLCEWFDDYNPINSRYPSKKTSQGVQIGATKAQQAFHYVATKFKRLFYSNTRRKLYVTLTNSLDSNSVDAALQYAKEIVKWEDESMVYCILESIYSTELSSHSH